MGDEQNPNLESPKSTLTRNGSRNGSTGILHQGMIPSGQLPGSMGREIPSSSMSVPIKGVFDRPQTHSSSPPKQSILLKKSFSSMQKSLSATPPFPITKSSHFKNSIQNTSFSKLTRGLAQLAQLEQPDHQEQQELPQLQQFTSTIPKKSIGDSDSLPPPSDSSSSFFLPIETHCPSPPNIYEHRKSISKTTQQNMKRSKSKIDLKNPKELLSMVAGVVKNRSGAVLARQTILKSDHFDNGNIQRDSLHKTFSFLFVFMSHTFFC